MLRAARTARDWVDETLLSPLWTVLLLPFRAQLTAENVVPLGLLAWLTRWVFRWTVLWALQWWLAPDWLISSQAGLQTALQVIPAVVVAVLVLVLGSILVIAQQLVAAYGTRAPMVMPQDTLILNLVARPLVVTIAAVLLAGQVPDQDSAVSDAITAAAASLALATVFIILDAAPTLPTLFFGYSGPVNFMGKVMDGVEDYLRGGAIGMVKFRITIFEDTIRAGIRRGDSRAIHVGLGGLGQFLDAYIAASKENPDVRTFTYEDGHEQHDWLGRDLATALRTAAEDSLGTLTSEEDMDSIGRATGHFAVKLVREGYLDEAWWLIQAMTSAGVSVQQIQPSGATNLFVKATQGLAIVESAAEEEGHHDFAAAALARWTLVISYANTHFHAVKHPRWEEDIATLGPFPPWGEAAKLIESEDFRDTWFNKMPGGVEPVIGWLQMSLEEHARQHEYELPPELQSGIVPGQRAPRLRRLLHRLMN